MSWDINNATPETHGAGIDLRPEQVLYRFDTPHLFVARMGLATVLCYKLDEFANSDLYLVAPAEDEIIEALKAGRLSVRGALAASLYWIVETQEFKSLRSWRALPHEIPDDFLPQSSMGLFEHFGVVPDTLQQANAFLSVKFSGPELHSDGLSMKTFKGLVDNFYDSVTKLFTPSSLTGARSSSLFDYEMYQPKFSSLVLSIKQPVIDIDAIRRRSKSASNTLHDDIQNEITADRDEFIRTAKELLARADRNVGLEEYVSQHYEFSSAIANLSPYDGGGYDRVEFNALTANGLEGVVITEQSGTRIRNARDSAASAPRQITGVVIEVNGERRTFVMKDRAERQVTCAFDWEMFERHHDAGSIFIGAKVTVYGDFWTRVRRDYVHVTRKPTFH
ncbi:MAG: hypothetical protein U1C74_07220 [Phenylobacterium sp.]|nr:hypothetical protein [Phenylobacterium sp.]